jgi:uncharacterized protein YdeI (YjbR/CyaY-like superfamily)
MSRSKAKSFTAVLESLRNGLGWVIARIPFDVEKTWPVRKGLRVRGEIEGFQFRTSLFPHQGGGHCLLVNKKMQAAARARAGDQVKLRLEPDLEERGAVVPPELAKVLKQDKQLRGWFDRLPQGLRGHMSGLVSQPKSGAARERRAEQTAEWLLQAMEGEMETPPILRAAFQRQPLARAGWEAMTRVQRRNHLLGIFHVQGAEARERRAAQAVEDALRVAGKAKNLEE